MISIIIPNYYSFQRHLFRYRSKVDKHTLLFKQIVAVSFLLKIGAKGGRRNR